MARKRADVAYGKITNGMEEIIFLKIKGENRENPKTEVIRKTEIASRNRIPECYLSIAYFDKYRREAQEAEIRRRQK